MHTMPATLRRIRGHLCAALVVGTTANLWAGPQPADVAPASAPAATHPVTPLPADAYGRLPLISDAAISPDGTKIVLAISDQTGMQAFRVLSVDNAASLYGARVDSDGREDERTVLRSVGWANDAYLSYVMSATFRTDRALPANVTAPGQSRIDLWRSGIGDIAKNRNYFVTRNESTDWGLQLAGLIAPSTARRTRAGSSRTTRRSGTGA